jgi:phosphoenolpyruvate carboxykinase (GTP)
MTKNQKLMKWVEDIAALTKPDSIHWCDGSRPSKTSLCDLLVKAGTFKPLDQAPRQLRRRLPPSDVARRRTAPSSAASARRTPAPPTTGAIPAEMRAILRPLFPAA